MSCRALMRAGDRFFERPDRAHKRLGSIVSERRQFWKIRGRNEYGPVIMFQLDWIRQHFFESSSLRPAFVCRQAIYISS